MSDSNKYLDYEGLSKYNTKINKVINDGDSVSNEITVELGTGGQLGGYKTGDKISANTSLEAVIKKLLAKQVPPTYTAPTISLSNNSGTASGAYEYGSIIIPKVKATFTKNDAGNLTAIAIKQGSTEVATGTASPLTYAATESITLTETVTFTTTVSYNEGAVKNDNLGDAYPTGHIAAGSKTSSNYNYTTFRQGYFWGVLDSTSADTPLTSAIIRSGTKKNGAYAAGDITGIKAADVANRKRIFVACPATKTGVTKVTMPSAMNADCTSDFKKLDSAIAVEGANGSASIDYNVWVYEPSLISDDQTFKVTLG